MLIEDLQKFATFTDLDRLELKKLLQFSELKRFRANESVFEKGRVQAGVLLVLSGEVELREPPEDGSEGSGTLIEVMKAGDVIGEATLFGDAVARPYSAVAGEPSMLLWVNTLDFRRLQNSAPMILTKLLLRMIIDVSNDFRKRNGEFGALKKELESLENPEPAS